MRQWTQAERFLIQQIRTGDERAWTQLVERYGGRLTAFARSKLRNAADAEDLVQDSFISFLQGLGRFREQASIETYLFTILRRKIISSYRGKRHNVCYIQDVLGGEYDDAENVAEQLPSDDPTASFYARRDEQLDHLRDVLAEALSDLVRTYKTSLNFRDLKIVEMLYYCQLRNKDIARVVDISEKHVALIKHRTLKQVREQCAAAAAGDATSIPGDLDHTASLLTEIWQSRRPSCPKRTTIGAYVLGTLEADWHEYVAFHLERLGCMFCRANFDDLQRQSDDDSSRLRHRVLESTVGFLRSKS